MRRLITLSILALLIGLTGYQASAANDRSAPAPPKVTVRGAAAFPTGTWNAGIQVQNPTSSTAAVQVKFYDSNGVTPVYTTGSGGEATSIAAGGSATYYLPSITGLADGKYSAVVESDQPVVVVVNETNYTGLGIADAYNGITTGASTLNLPLIFRAYSNWDSLVAVQNTDSSNTATVALKFYKTGEATPTYTKSDTIPALASKTYDVSSTAFSSLGSPFLGSLVITSTTNVAAVAHSAKSATQPTNYDVLTVYQGFTSGATRYLAPLVFNQYSPSDTTGWVSGIQVQNLGSTADTVTMTYSLDPRLGMSGGPYVSSQAIGANSSVTFYMPSVSGVPAGTYGSAVIQSGSNNVVAIVNTTKYLTGVANAYNAIASGGGSTRVVAPLVFARYSPNTTLGWVTGIQVQNLGTADDTVTMVFKPSNASSVSGAASSYTKSKTASAGSSATFYLPDYTDIPAGLYGTAEVTSTTQKIIAVVNTTKYSASVATTYLGINP